VQTVELLLDPTTDSAVRAEWQRLAEVGLPSQARHHGGTNAPHITLGVAEMIPEEVEGQLSLAADGWCSPGSCSPTRACSSCTQPPRVPWSDG
jgi:hypothetical protein